MKSEIIDIEEIQKVIIAYANGDFNHRLSYNPSQNERSTIIAGVNMLGEELKEKTISRDFFSSIFNSANEFLTVIDEDGKIIEINKASAELLGVDEHGKGMNLFDLIMDYPGLVKHIKSYLSNGNNIEIETTFNKGSISFPMECFMSKIFDRNDEQNGYLVVWRDITEKKNHEHRTYMKVVAALERERKRLAYDLHDSFSQDLNAIKIFIDNLTRLDQDSTDYKKSIDACKSVIENTINSAKGMAFDLLPKSLEKGDLTFAIDQLCNKYPHYFNFDLHLEVEIINLALEVKTIIYRILQEFISNSIKHSKSKDLSIHITQIGDKYEFTFKDYGIGFDIKNTPKGNGLHNIISRLNAINAKYKLDSHPQRGTTLNFTIP